MMKTNVYLHTFFYGCMAAMILTSCGDFLEEVSQDEFEPKTASSFQELMNGEGYMMYPVDPITYMMDDDVQGCKGSMWDDVLSARQAIFEWQPDYWQVENDCQSISGFMKNSYLNIYKTIAACNIIIENLPGSDGSQTDKDITMAEAKTMRAFYYWRLVNTYALPYNDKQTKPETNLGVPLVTSSEVKDEGVPRASVAEVYAQIISDIEDACSLFGNDTSSRGIYRINHTSAHLLASRIYLFTEQWDKVIEHASKAMATAPALVNLKSYNIDNTLTPTNGVISKKFGETIFICGMKAMSGDYSLMGTPFGVSKELAYLYETMDRRMNTYIMPSGYDYYPYRILKNCADEHEYTWRTAELYLNRAEAYMNLYMQGQQEAGQQAIDDLNTLRVNRYRVYTNVELTTADELQRLLRDERRRELCFEGFRFFDLKRYGMPRIEHTLIGESGTALRYVLEERDPSYCVPLPDNALEHNENLVQNPLANRRVGEQQ
ncbi:MAG: RagB/SusD family nutrient uptake outer membrane protein [Prevotella sp.]|nr:RagB/SusD family nutrient uptake outer membrane protein [Prevotella sp.]